MIDLEDEPQRAGPPPWIITFADLMVLLMCFFVLMLSFSEMDVAKFKQISGAMNTAFGVQARVVAHESPKGTSTVATQFGPGAPEPTDRDEVRQHTVDSDLDTLDVGLEQRLKELKAREERAEEQAQRLRDIFKQEIANGQLLIRRDATDVVIQILEKDSFASGSAELEPGSLDALRKIGRLLTGLGGAVRVSGHTDNVPIRNGQYRSNWDLSAARAASVAHELLLSGLEPKRLVVSGYADTQPRVPNDTPANRALNRRVDITLANGPASGEREPPTAEDAATPSDADEAGEDPPGAAQKTQ